MGVLPWAVDVCQIVGLVEVDGSSFIVNANEKAVVTYAAGAFVDKLNL